MRWSDLTQRWYRDVEETLSTTNLTCRLFCCLQTETELHRNSEKQSEQHRAYRRLILQLLPMLFTMYSDSPNVDCRYKPAIWHLFRPPSYYRFQNPLCYEKPQSWQPPCWKWFKFWWWFGGCNPTVNIRLSHVFFVWNWPPSWWWLAPSNATVTGDFFPP